MTHPQAIELAGRVNGRPLAHLGHAWVNTGASADDSSVSVRNHIGVETEIIDYPRDYEGYLFVLAECLYAGTGALFPLKRGQT